jgi:hypothetical protein
MILFYIVIIIFSWIFVPKIYRYINKKRHPFSGKIETFKDVNDFIANYDLFYFADKDNDGVDYNYHIVTKRYNSNIFIIILSTRTITIPKGIYKSEKYDNYWFAIHNRINEPIRAFVWKHKDAINAALDVEKIIKEKDRKEKEKNLKLKELDKNIKKDIFKVFRDN